VEGATTAFCIETLTDTNEISDTFTTVYEHLNMN